MGFRTDETGAVTAETAMVIPVLVLLTAALAWMVAFGVAQVRAVDGARETARALARGEDVDTSTALGKRVAPPGSRISVRESEDTVEVIVRSEVQGPAGLFGFLPPRTLEAHAVAVREPTS